VARKFVYYWGLDLGQSADYSALAIIEEPVWLGRWTSPSDLPPELVAHAVEKTRREGRPPNPPLGLRHLERFELGTPYPRIAERVRALANTPPLDGKPGVLLVDKTGVGAGVIDHLVHVGINPTPVVIHGGAELSADNEGRGYRVPKRDLVSAVQVLLQTSRLKVAASLPEAETLRRELLNFRVKIDPKTAHDSYSHWREGDHDDLVLATAMACWFREWWNALVEVRYADEERQRKRGSEAV
jgi:hypothetical protein